MDKEIIERNRMRRQMESLKRFIAEQNDDDKCIDAISTLFPTYEERSDECDLLTRCLFRKRLLIKLIEVGVKDSTGNLLIEACQYANNPSVVKLILSHKTYTRDQLNSAMIKLVFSYDRRYKEVLQLFIESGADTNYVDKYQKSFIQIAVEYDNLELLEELLNVGVKPTPELLVFTLEQKRIACALMLVNEGLIPPQDAIGRLTPKVKLMFDKCMAK